MNKNINITSDPVSCKICTSRKTKFLYKKDNFDIRKCIDCEIVFTDLPLDFNLEEIYDESYFQGGQEYGYGNYEASENVLRIEFKKSVQLLNKLTSINTGKKLLEIGSAYGYFLD